MCIRRHWIFRHHWICGRLGHLGRCCRVTRSDVSLVVDRFHHVCTYAHTDGGVFGGEDRRILLQSRSDESCGTTRGGGGRSRVGRTWSMPL